MDIKTALAELDHTNDEHWTTDGAPRVDVVANIAGLATLKRQDITNAAPQFMRGSIDKGEDQDDHGKQETGQPKNDESTPATGQPESALKVTGADQGPQEGGTDEASAGGAGDEIVVEANVEAPGEGIATGEQTEVIRGELQQLEADLAERSREMIAAQQEADAARQRADHFANQVNALNRKIEVLHKQDPNHAMKDIQAYLKQSNANRLARHEGLQKFVGMTGVHPADAAAAVDPRSPLDKAMRTRKPARGSERPNRAAAR